MTQTAPPPPASLSLVRRFNRRLALLAAGITLLFLLVINAAVANRFERLEEREVASHVERAEMQLQQIGTGLKASGLDWAVWDVTWDYFHGTYPAFIEENLDHTSLHNLNVNGMALVDRDGRMRGAVYAEHETGAMSEPLARSFGEVARQAVLAERRGNGDTVQGFALMGDKLMGLSVTKVYHSDGAGPSNGFLVVGREIPSSYFTESLALPATITPDVSHPRPQLVATWQHLAVTVPVRDVSGAPIALLTITAPRVLAEEGLRLVALASIGALLAGLLLVLAFGGMVRQLVLTPLAQFQGHVEAIATSGELRPYAGEARDDELGRLYAEFNAMVSEMAVLRARVEAQGYSVGKRDHAASVMHNIGNGVGPVKTILSRLEAEMLPQGRNDVRRALDELAAGMAEDTRPARLLAFLRAVADGEADDALARRDLIRTALRSVDNVEGILAAAMAETRADPLAGETTALATVLANCVALARQRDTGIAITLQCDGRFPVKANRVLLAQVFENLLKNAVEAIGATGKREGRITVIAVPVTNERGPAAAITIRDNGDGFAPAAAARLFEHGRSTRDKAVGGIGLHWCANTVAAMGGTLALTSEGPGLGAVATVTLPVASAMAAPPAAAKQPAEATEQLDFVI